MKGGNLKDFVLFYAKFFSVAGMCSHFGGILKQEIRTISGKNLYFVWIYNKEFPFYSVILYLDRQGERMKFDVLDPQYSENNDIGVDRIEKNVDRSFAGSDFRSDRFSNVLVRPSPGESAQRSLLDVCVLVLARRRCG